jgi:hypothetical protein
MKWFLTIIGILIFVSALVAGLFFGASGWIMTIALGGLVVFLMFANLEHFSAFKFSQSGIEAQTREVRAVITKAESTLAELQLLARNVAEVTLSLVKRTGRWDGYADDEADRIKTSVLAVLTKVGVPETDFPSILSDWNRFTEFDYAHFILGGGGSQVPDTQDLAIIEEWKNLRHGGINDIPTPSTLRTFLTKHNFMTDNLDEYLKDYEHFLAYREHRRPEVWADRQHWERLKTP